MKRAEKYLRAAEWLDENGYGGCCKALAVTSCAAILNPGKDCNCRPTAKAFEALFKPEDAGTFWWGDPEPKNKEPRILALLFAHQIALDEEKIAGRIGGK